MIGPGILLPHPDSCCARGRDHHADGKIYVTHESESGKRWGYTILLDRGGRIVDRWRIG